jgi:hypothetical protein
MALNYGLSENKLTERPDDWSAITYPVASLDKEAVITRILSKGTTLTRTDVLAVLNALEEVVAEGSEQGYVFNLPLFNTSFSISGVFDSPLDSFDPSRHKLNINLTKGVRLREAEKRVKLEKTNIATPLPQIQEVKDSVSGTVNECLTARGVVEVRGYNLKIEGDDPSCGLWFVNQDGTETKAEVIIENKPTRILAMIPDLSVGTGTFQVKVVSQFSGGGRLLLTPKVFMYPKSLQVCL